MHSVPCPADTVTLQVASLFTRATGHGDGGARNDALSAARQIQKFTREQPECGSQARRHGVQLELGRRRWTRAAALAASQSVSHCDGAGGSELSGPLGIGTGPDTKH